MAVNNIPQVSGVSTLSPEARTEKRQSDTQNPTGVATVVPGREAAHLLGQGPVDIAGKQWTYRPSSASLEAPLLPTWIMDGVSNLPGLQGDCLAADVINAGAQALAKEAGRIETRVREMRAEVTEAIDEISFEDMMAAFDSDVIANMGNALLNKTDES